MQVARILAELQQAQVSAERIVGLLELELEIHDSKEIEEKFVQFFILKEKTI